jgi:hypothetical protein
MFAGMILKITVICHFWNKFCVPNRSLNITFGLAAVMVDKGTVLFPFELLAGSGFVVIVVVGTVLG